MATAGVYRRLLPSPPATEFGSPEGKMVFREALGDGTMEGFFKLIAHFQTQAEPAFCGLASLSVVLNALAIDPGRTWKGLWRWIDESMLECCESLEKVKEEGMTFAKVACAGACAGASVQAIRSNTSSLDQFRQHVLDSCSLEDKHMIVSYDRKLLKQTGSGHFSPIGGYHRGKDLALILDVARFKYPPHWVPLSLLWEAVNTIDPTTANWRGFLLMTKPERHPSVLFTLSCKDELWRPISRYLIEELPKILSSADIKSTEEAMSVVLGLMPGKVTSFVKWIVEVRRADTALANVAIEVDLALSAKVKILESLRKTGLYVMVSNWASDASEKCPCSVPSLAEDNLSEALKSVCCHGAATFSGMLNSSALCCTKTSVTQRSKSGSETLVVAGDISTAQGNGKHVDVIIPTSLVCNREGNCIQSHPASADMLTMLLFALHPKIWCTIKNENIQSELFHNASVTNLPMDFQVEVENLREQLYLVHKWCNGKIDKYF